MKSFNKFITEGGIGTTDQNLAVDNGANGAIMSDIQNPKVLKALNAYVA